MQAVQNLLARLFTKSTGSDTSNHELSPTESEKNILNTETTPKVTPAGLNDGPILKEISETQESSTSLEILEVRSFDSEDELRILRSNYHEPKPFNLLEVIQNAAEDEAILKYDMKQYSIMENSTQRSLLNQPQNLDLLRESQHEKESGTNEINSMVPDTQNAVIEFKNETQGIVRGQSVKSRQVSELELDLDMIDRIEESLISKHILKDVVHKADGNVQPTAFEQIMGSHGKKRKISFEEENITSEDDDDELKQKQVVKETEPQQSLADLMKDVGPVITPEVPTNQINIDITGKNEEATAFGKYPIGSPDIIEEPSKFIIQKFKTPYLDTNEINTIIDPEAKNIVKDDSPENPLLNGFFSQKKNKLKKRKVYVASEIKTLNSSLFTTEDDDLIKEYVRRNPHLKNSHSLYEHIAKTLKNHTGNSIRRRFFNKLEKEMEFYYAVGENGELVQDSEGNAVKKDDLPSTQKTKFTAEEDYSMALLMKCHIYLSLNPDVEDSIDRYDIAALDKMEREYYEKNLIPDDANTPSDKNIVPSNPDIPCSNNGKVIDWKPDFAQFRCNGTNGPMRKEILQRLMMWFSSHSLKSWRDRYTRFLKPYGVDRFIYYYNKCRVLKIEPEPITGLTSAATRAKLLQTSSTFPEDVTLADLEMKFTRRRV